MVKCLLIGFDGASVDKIKSLTARGQLPTFAKFLKNGCAGTMKSTMPPVSAAAWSSLYMGVNPGKHGIFYFISPNGHVILSDKIAGRTVWDIIGNSGKKVILVNMPMTYPPYRINGIMIAGFPSPSNRLSVYPQRLKAILNQAIPDYQVDTSYVIAHKYEGMDKDSFYNDLCRVTNKRSEMALYLMENYQWGFFAVVFTSLDRISHVFWNDEHHYITRYYKLLDKILRDLTQSLDKDIVTFVVSDHGFENLHTMFGINNWLEKHGFLKTTRLGSKKRISNLLLELRRKLPFGVRKRIPLSFRRKTRLPRIDFSKTEVYSPFKGAIISPRQHREKVKGLLQELDFVEKVFEKEEIYSGPHVKNAPDLLLALKNGYVPISWAEDVIESVRRPQKNETYMTGDHQGLKARKALFMAKGKLIKKGHINPNIIDIAPTILKLMDIETPTIIEGKVLDILSS